MNQPFLKRIFPIIIGFFGLLQTRCNFPDSPKAETVPTPSLQGRWRLDSGTVTFYNRGRQMINQLRGDDATGPAGFISIGPDRWHFWNGITRAAWTYTRHGDTLVIQRLTDTALVRGGHAQWEDLGKPIGLPDTSVITVLNAHSLVRLDSTMYPDGSTMRVSRDYYSR